VPTTLNWCFGTEVLNNRKVQIGDPPQRVCSADTFTDPCTGALLSGTAPEGSSGPWPWAGVSCRTLGNITRIEKLQLASSALTCQLGVIDLGQFAKVTELTLNDNNISGTIPDSLGSLRELITLELRNNFMRGSLPRSIGGASSLSRLSLTNQRAHGAWQFGPNKPTLPGMLGGSIPSEFTALTRLTHVDVGFNRFSGGLPDFSALTLLQVLHLNDADFNGSLMPLYSAGYNETSAVASNLPWRLFAQQTMKQYSLRDIQLHNNRFTGAIPKLPAITSFTGANLQTLTVGGNLLTGTLPDPPASLTIFSAGGVSPAGNSNAFSCPFPSNHSAFQDVQCTCLAGSYCPR
jgi:hypothetical protein